MSNSAHPHIIDGEFQSDKYPGTPRGFVPLKCSDPDAQPLLWQYAHAHREKDAQFSDDLLIALKMKGFDPGNGVNLKKVFLNFIEAMGGLTTIEAGIVKVIMPDGSKWDFTVPEQNS